MNKIAIEVGNWVKGTAEGDLAVITLAVVLAIVTVAFLFALAIWVKEHRTNARSTVGNDSSTHGPSDTRPEVSPRSPVRAGDD